MPEITRPRVGILISGRGSNMAALIAAMRDGRVPADAAIVISNVPEAAGFEAHLEALGEAHFRIGAIVPGERNVVYA